MKKLHSGTLWIFRLQGLAIFLGIYIFSFFFSLPFLLGLFAANFFILTIIDLIVVMAITEIYARMTYNRWFYEFTNNNLKLERGIIWKRYSNIPYERVQNVDITRGIIARIFGFSTVMVQTAGFSYSPRKFGAGAEGHIPGVDIKEAERIRDFLMKKISKNGRKQGL